MEQKEKAAHADDMKRTEQSAQFGGYSFDEIRQSIQKDAQELFDRAIFAGTAGIYIRENLPLYFISDSLLKVLGYTYEQYHQKFGNSYYEALYPDDRDMYTQELISCFDENRTFDRVCQFRTNDGQTHLMRDIGKRILDMDNRDCFLILRSDVTEIMEHQKKLEEKAAWYEEKSHELEALTANIPGGVCEVEMDDDFTLVYGNEGFYHLFGYTGKEYEREHHNRLIESIYDKDKEYVRNTIAYAQAHNEPIFEFEYRIIRRDSSVIWILVRGSFSCYQKKPLFNCVAIDITARKKIEEEARINERRFRIALAQTDNSIFEYDIRSRVMIHGDKSADYYGLQQITENVPDSLLMGGTVHSGTAIEFLDMYTKIREGAPTASCRIKTRLKDGYYAWRKITMTTIYDENGTAIQAIGFLEDIDEQVRREENLLYQSERDALTGLYNRRAMEHRIHSELESQKENQVSAMLILDIDNFKSVNDQYGHMCGDYVLQESAKRISSLFRSREIIGRIGGDEYIAFLSNLPSESVAAACGQRISDTFLAAFEERDIVLKISCSIGIAVSPQDGSTFEELYQNADTALYQAKKLGRDQVVCYTPDMTLSDGWTPYSKTHIDGPHR